MADPEQPPRQPWSIWRLIILSLMQFTVQFMYTVQLLVANPIESRLGLPHWSWPVIFAADPIAGIIIQPHVGRLSDRCESSLGRRRPFIIAGAAITIVSTVLLTTLESMSENQRTRQVLFIVFYVMYNIGLNGMQGPTETLFQDILPSEQLALGQSVASVEVGIAMIIASLPGAIVGLGGGSWEPTTAVLGVLIVVTAVAVGLSMVVAKEEPYRRPTGEPTRSMWCAYADVFSAIKRMPLQLWLAWLFIFCGMACYAPFQIVITDLCGTELFGGDVDLRPEAYRRGVGFGMLITTVSSAVGTVYCVFQDRLLRILGWRWLFVGLFGLSFIAFMPTLWVNNRWLLLVLCALPTPLFLALQSLGFVVVERTTPSDEAGMYMGVMDTAIEFAAEFAALAFQLGVGSRWVSRKPTLWCGAPMAVLGMMVCAFLKVPGAKVGDSGREQIGVGGSGSGAGAAVVEAPADGADERPGVE